MENPLAPGNAILSIGFIYLAAKKSRKKEKRRNMIEMLSGSI